MNAEQRRAIAMAAYVVAAILFVFFFGRQAWAWATWHDSQGTLDLGFLKVTTRPPFPNDARSVLVGLVLPVVIAFGGRMVEAGKKA